MAGKDLSALEPESITLAMVGPEDKLSPNFTLAELIKSDTAARQGIVNMPPSDEVLRSMVHLARRVLQPLRETFGPFRPNSVFRSNETDRVLNRKPAGWISTSQHVQGRACDVEMAGTSTLDLSFWVRDNLEFDQLICECYDPREGPNSGWVHVSFVPPGAGTNRRELLSYIRDPATQKFRYVKGLVASG